MLDYTAFYKDEIPLDPVQLSAIYSWDVLLSAYTPADRVSTLFGWLPAREKWWIIHDEYGYTPAQLPTGRATGQFSRDEEEFSEQLFADVGLAGRIPNLCIDITGFMRPQLLRVLYDLVRHGYSKVDLVYSEPIKYEKNEQTTFSLGEELDVRQVLGYEGIHEPDTSADVLVIGTGYDHELIKRVAYDKESAKKRLIYGLPSLRPHMYQENVYRVSRVADALAPYYKDAKSSFFAPANDPFVTASVIAEIVKGQNVFTNLYLSPLGTKVQCVAFALYYLTECVNQPISIIYPFRQGYAQETSTGLARAWHFEVELPTLNSGRSMF